MTHCSHESERAYDCSDCSGSDRHSDGGFSCYDLDGSSGSECSSGCWDATAFPFSDCVGAVSGAVEAESTDDGWLDDLLTVGSSREDPWVAAWL